LDRIGKGQRISQQPRAPRKFTFYRCRDYVKTLISDLGYGDYAEWFIGHAGSTYYSQTKARPHITLLDIQGMEAKGADIQTKLDRNEEVVRAMQNRINRLERLATLLLAEEKHEWLGRDGKKIDVGAVMKYAKEELRDQLQIQQELES
jgi:hypothetical protein